MKKCIFKITMKNIYGFPEEVEIGSERYNELRAINELENSIETLCKTLTSLRKEFKSRLQNQRHQICEKIRNDFEKLCEDQDNLDYICTYGLDKILDQIERGEV